MNRFALVAGGSVVNIVESPGKPSVDLGGEWLICGNSVGPGDLYDGTSFSKPELVVDWRVTKLAFLNRFSQPERLAIRTAAKASVAIEDYMAMVTEAKWIDLNRTDARTGVLALESLGLLAIGRALQILDAPVQPEERP
jgi:hypothetical protein